MNDAIDRVLATEESRAEVKVLRRPSAMPGARRGRLRQLCATASSSSARSARRCAASAGSPPSSRTSPRSSTASCGSSRSCSSASTRRATCEDAENSLRELSALAETAGAVVLDGLLQRRPHPDPSTYFGKGKAARAEGCRGRDRRRYRDRRHRARPQPATRPRGCRRRQGHRPHGGHPRHLQPAREEPRGQGPGRARAARVPPARACAAGASRCPDRPVAKSAPATEWEAVDLVRRRSSSIAAASTTRMSKLRRQIKGFTPAREAKRANRTRFAVPSVAITGYTNAGKSSLLNRLTKAGVLVENALFATLDTSVRRSITAGRARVHAHRHRRIRPQPACTSWWRRSAPPSRRCATPTSSSTWSTHRIRILPHNWRRSAT